MRAFESSTMGWDAARVSAAIPSGVGFLGAGLIWKGSEGAGVDEAPAVHGLTTAARCVNVDVNCEVNTCVCTVLFCTVALH